MVWFVVDDVLPFHERVLRAGNAAMGLWVRAGAWCTGHLTDGFIPADVARTMGKPSEIRSLVDVGLWEKHVKDGDTGYLFHAWAEDGTGTKRQQTKAEVEKKRRQDRERQAAWRAAQKAREDAEDGDLSQRDSQRDSQCESRRESQRPSQALPSPSLPSSPLRSEEGGSPPVENLGTDPEPPARCPAHLGLARPPKCGACKDARLEHEAWTKRQADVAAAPRPPRFDPETYCEHLQIRGACETCDYEAKRSSVVIAGPWGAA